MHVRVRKGLFELVQRITKQQTPSLPFSGLTGDYLSWEEKLVVKWATRDSLHDHLMDPGITASSVFIRLKILHQLKPPISSSTQFSHYFISKFFPFLRAEECPIETVTLSCPTCWDGTFRCRRTSAGGWVGAGPSRCSAAPRGWALRLPTHTGTHTADGNHQSSCSEGISCWLPATAAQYQVYVQTEALAAPTAWTLSSWREASRSDPPCTLTAQTIKRMEAGCLGSRTVAGGVFKVSFYTKQNLPRPRTFYPRLKLEPITQIETSVSRPHLGLKCESFHSKCYFINKVEVHHYFSACWKLNVSVSVVLRIDCQLNFCSCPQGFSW